MLLGGLLVWGTWGCSAHWVREWTQPSATELDYGRSVSHNMAQQIVKPPGGSAGPPVGLSPQAAQNVMEAYNNTFVKKKEEKSKGIIVDVAK